MRAAAGVFSGLVAAGHQPPQGMFVAIIAAARVMGLLQDPAVLAAGKWQDWLHPRGKDGKFIVKDSWVNIFANPHSSMDDPHADRRRAQITQLTPDGAFVKYVDATKVVNGKPEELAPDPDNGFPELIPVSQLAGKVATAPQPIAWLHQPQVTGQSARAEFDAGHYIHGSYNPAMTRGQYDQAIADFNDSIFAAGSPLADYADQPKVVSTGQGEISEADFAKHSAYISAVTDMALHGPGQGLGTDSAFKDSYGLWSEEYQQIFDDTVDAAFQELTNGETKPKDRRSMLVGGLPGAGKSSTLDSLQASRALRPEDWITVNPDFFKDKMLESGHYPQVAGLTPAETASFIHEASSEMNHMLETLLMAEGYNIIFDITMGGRARPNEKTWIEKLGDTLVVSDYQMDGLFVDVNPAISRTRVNKRHQDGLNALRTGASDRPDDPAVQLGGRVVPDKVIADNELPKDDPNAAEHNSQNSVNFANMQPYFARWAVYDNSGKTPSFVAGSASSPEDTANLPGFYPPADAGTDAAPGGSTA